MWLIQFFSREGEPQIAYQKVGGLEEWLPALATTDRALSAFVPIPDLPGWEAALVVPLQDQGVLLTPVPAGDDPGQRLHFDPAKAAPAAARGMEEAGVAQVLRAVPLPQMEGPIFYASPLEVVMASKDYLAETPLLIAFWRGEKGYTFSYNPPGEILPIHLEEKGHALSRVASATGKNGDSPPPLFATFLREVVEQIEKADREEA